jgi:two-component sensor histidine kinase
MRVLVIDDNPDDRQLVLREVKALFPDAQAVELKDLASFEAALDAGTPDLVVTDLDLRWSSGRDVFAATKACHPACPVVMFTGSGDETTAVELMKSGLDDYVVKSARQLPRLRTSLRIAVEAARTRAALTAREARLAAALAHQRTVVQELHHRVKNNLQTIVSLLQLRAKARGGVVAEELNDLAGRMHALAAVQARIYETEALDQVRFTAVLLDMAERLVAVRAPGEVELMQEGAGPLDLDVARAMPLGLLCYEVLLNALKHAWPAGQRGRLVVEVGMEDGQPEICISDNGIGYASDSVSKGLGSRLVRALAAEARVEVETVASPGGGTSVSLRLI